MSRKEYEVYNFGPARIIPYKGSGLNIQQSWGFTTSDKKLVKHLKAFPAISVKEVSRKKGPYASINYMKLRKMAREMGFDIDKKIKKNELIKLMEER